MRGRKFYVETDYNTLEKTQKKSDFENNRDNRYIEKFIEFNLSVSFLVLIEVNRG
jgi:hypothetical protein